MLTLYKKLISFRRKHLALEIGDYIPVATDGDLFIYERRSRDERLLIALNLGHVDRSISLPDGISIVQVLLSTHVDRDDDVSELRLRPDEGIIALLSIEQAM